LDTVKLELSDGDWIEVKRELTYGDQLALQWGSRKPGETESMLYLDMKEFYVNRILIWVTAWSLQDDKGPVELSADAERALRDTDAAELNKVLIEYIEAQEASKN
jgi:hypothetical protein